MCNKVSKYSYAFSYLGFFKWTSKFVLKVVTFIGKMLHLWIFYHTGIMDLDSIYCRNAPLYWGNVAIGQLMLKYLA